MEKKKITVSEFAEDFEVVISQASITYSQKCDVNSGADQFLEILIDSNGNGHYIVVKTDRWAINDVGELINVLNDFKKRIPTT